MYNLVRGEGGRKGGREGGGRLRGKEGEGSHLFYLDTQSELGIVLGSTGHVC